MHPFNLKDIEKPYKIKKENVDGFNKKIKD
jgi:hypothetical protein